MRKTTFSRALYELLSSMRFAVTLLTLVAIASIIGTVLKQNEPYPNYQIQFGTFWFGPFEWLGLFDVYHASWFLLILAFLVLSTTLCIWRNLPGMLKEMRSFRLKASYLSLKQMSHSVSLPGSPEQVGTLSLTLQKAGYRVREKQEEGVTLLAAKKGSWQKLGYFFAHIAIIVICIGGLMDGNLPLKIAEMMGKVTPETRDIPQSQIPPISRLATDNLSFRGSVTIPAGKSTDVIFLNAGKGYLVQDLPFHVKLKQFHIEHYSTGMPKLFASDIEVTDKATGKVTSATVKVNHPLIVDGIAIYQASFGDGGSKLDITQWPLTGAQANSESFTAVSQSSQAIRLGGENYTLEWGDFRPFNIEDMGDKNAAVAVNSQLNQLMSKLDAARQVKAEKNVRNLGPSIQYKLRDRTGQAKEFLTYLAPFVDEGRSYIVGGSRSEVGAPFRFMRLPLDERNSLQDFMRLRALISSETGRAQIAGKTADSALKAGGITAATRPEFEKSIVWALQQFNSGGFAAIENFLKARVPEDKRQLVAQTYIKLLQGSIMEADLILNPKAAVNSQTRYPFLMDSLVGMSASFEYGMPVFLQLSGFDEVKASGLQLTRSPGKNVVYLGSLLLVLGIFFMFYVRETRVWVRLSPEETLVAMSANRKNPELDKEFAELTAALQTQLPHKDSV